MSLSQEELAKLLRWVGLTRDKEIDCDECASLIAEFAERELASKSIPEGLRRVEHHLQICEECHEEYEALLLALKSLKD